MGLLTFILLLLSSVMFYKYSKRNALSIVFIILSLSLAFWGLFVFLSDIQFPILIRVPIIDLIVVFPLFIPILLTYIIFNYTRPNYSISPPVTVMITHLVIITFFLLLSWESRLTPFILENDEVVFKGNVYYYLYCGYLFGSILISLILIIRNINREEYFVRLHSLYMFTGITVGLLISTVLTLILPLIGISLNSISVIGLLIFLWVTWIPIAHYRLFNVDLLDFKQDLQNPRISSAIISINRFLLNRLEPEAYKKICEQLENEQKRILMEMSANLVIDHSINPTGFEKKLIEYIGKVRNLFFKS
ncbi:putative membrane protein [Leptospira broomii serovar Hurstbridge str. 5399]|uniref:Membrane protein n=1 Tax=Leptospira broomii serovar Hurstbridge str. 5399 TaxID=1049789 RepID=T0GIY7_9LEPT|nr:histidine kinase N-terminal 7TM domain-containing protein [Leptospira broomii]EQA45343.1 putative membrane protein [Leptospira broomii serovar Hurstbridge str. 5399]